MRNTILSMSVNNKYIKGPEFGNIDNLLKGSVSRKKFLYLFRKTKSASRRYGLGVELATIEPTMVRQLRPLIEVLRNEIRDLPIATAHLPHQTINIASVNESQRKNAVKQQSEWIRFYAKIGVKIIVVHPAGELINGKFGQLYGTLERDNAIASLFELDDVAKSHGMVCGFENLVKIPHKTGKKFNDRTTFSSRNEIIDLTDLGLNVVWDTLHWRQSGYKLQEWIEAGLLRKTVLAHIVGGTRKHGKITQNSQEVWAFNQLPENIPATLAPDDYCDLRPSLVSLGLI